MDEWQRYVGTALVGTNRQTPELPTENSALAIAIRQLNWQQPESALLGAAGAIALHQKVGWRPDKRDFSPIEPCDVEDLPCCSDRILKLFDIATSKQLEVLPELLELMASAGARLSAKRLPQLLNLGKRKKELRSSVRLVLGKRGQWLAKQNKRWAYATKETDTTVPPSTKPAVTKQFPTKTTKASWQWFDIALQESQRWDIEFSRLALKRFFEAASIRSNHIELSRLSVPLAVALHPGLATEVAQRVRTYAQDKNHPTLQRFLERLSATISLRWEIYQAFIFSR